MECDMLERRLGKLEKQAEIIRKKLRIMPSGELLCNKNGKYSRWYCTDGKTRKYISKKDREYAAKLAEKKYLMLQQYDLNWEIDLLKKYLNKYEKHTSKADEFIKDANLDGLQTEVFATVDESARAWAEEDYERNNWHPEMLKYKSCTGRMLRSKSEMMIDQALASYQIAYRYEPVITLPDGTRVAPDFVIMKPKTGEIILWEHLGMMDSYSYAARAHEKMINYMENGYFPFVNIIYTMETLDEPLSGELIERIITTFIVE